MKPHIPFLAPLLALLVLTSGCRNDMEGANPDSRAHRLESPQQPLSVEDSSRTEPGFNPELQPLVDMALRDLAEKLRASHEDIQIITAAYVTWPDSSLGCPQPDMGYLQALTDGLLIVLRYDGADYHYHGRREGPPFFCKSPRNPVVGQSDQTAS